MSKRFQFSMRGMFAMVTLFCVELGLFAALKKLVKEDREGVEYLRIVCVIACMIVIGIGYRRPLAGLFWGLAVAVGLLALVIFWQGNSH